MLTIPSGENIVAALMRVRENIGWGRVQGKILGLHDQGETEIPSKDLPGSCNDARNIGGSLSNSGQTPALRQGNMVFGFFMDGSAIPFL